MVQKSLCTSVAVKLLTVTLFQNLLFISSIKFHSLDLENYFMVSDFILSTTELNLPFANIKVTDKIIDFHY